MGITDPVFLPVLVSVSAGVSITLFGGHINA